LVEAALIAQSNAQEPKRKSFWRWIMLAVAAGLVIGCSLMLLIHTLV